MVDDGTAFLGPWEVLLQCSSDLLTALDADGTLMFANAASEQLLGLPPEQLLGTRAVDHVHAEDRHAFLAQLTELSHAPGQVATLRFRVLHVDGTHRHVESLVRNGLDDPSLRCLVVSTRDVSGRAVAEDALRDSEARHRRLVESAPMGLVVVDQVGVIRFVNPAVLTLMGLSRTEELLGRQVTEFLHPDERQACREQLRRTLVDRVAPGPLEYRVLRAAGTPMVVSSAPLPYDWEGRPAALLMLQDVTSLRQAEEERNSAIAWLSQILRASAEGIVCLDEDGRITFMNPAAAEILGLDVADALGQPAHPLYHHSNPDGSPYPEERCPCLGATRHEWLASVVGEVFWRSDGTPVPVEYRATPLTPDAASGAVLTFHDVSERLRAKERLARLADFQSAVLDSLPSLTAVVDRTGEIIATNEAWDRYARERGGRPETCGVGVDFLRVCDETDGPARTDARTVAQGLRALLAGRAQAFHQDIPCVYDQESVFFSLQMVPLNAVDGGTVISYTDITARKRLEIAAAHRATHDVLTGLPNRVLLLERLGHVLVHRGERPTALLFLDLDSFKLVNDGYGHEAGDAVLRELSGRLLHHVRPSDTVARLAGDEFVVLCEDLPHVTEAQLLAERLITSISEPFLLGDTTLTLGVSIGIALVTEPEMEAGALLRAADQAMFEAKARGRNRFAVFDADVRGRNAERLEQAMTLRRMVEDGDLLVHYQPVIDLRDGHLSGSEALLRWRGPHRLPDAATAITLAEEVGLIGRIGQFVLGTATTEGATFLTGDGTVLPLAVNLAPQQLSRAFVGQLEQAADDAGFPLSSMTLELTERSVMMERSAAIDVLRTLRQLGVQVALDDFGVGYSSLAALRDLPLDVLKIDAGFVRGLVGPDADDRLVAAIISMAHALDLEVVAEGIEQVGQRDRLLDLGCQRGQGFLWSAALPAAEMRARARAQTSVGQELG